MKKFEFLSHTADIKIRVYGKNLKEIINNSLLALKSFWKPKLTKTKIEKEIKVESNNEVNLLIDFLSEVLAETYVEKAIFVKFLPRINADFHTDKRGLYSLSGKIIGYKFTSLSKDIKAVTYHQAVLNKVNKNYIFEFIIDI
jgi:SHS2 domain-containing protein